MSVHEALGLTIKQKLKVFLNYAYFFKERRPGTEFTKVLCPNYKLRLITVKSNARCRSVQYKRGHNSYILFQPPVQSFCRSVNVLLNIGPVNRVLVAGKGNSCNTGCDE